MLKQQQKISNDKVRCLLCPRYCEIKHGEAGYCLIRHNDKGDIVLKDYAAISSVAVEPIEKKPIVGFLSGTKTLSIGGYSCNLHCLFCENNRISRSGVFSGSPKFLPKDVVNIAKEKDCLSVCLTYNEPTIAIEYLMDVAEACHHNGLKFIIKTNAYINPEPWKEVCKVVDAMNIDYKGYGSYFEDITQSRYEDYEEKINIARENDVHIELSIPVLPGYSNDDHLYFWPLKTCLADIGEVVHMHLLKINPAYLMINSPTTSDEDIEKAREDLSYYFDEEYIHV